MTTTTAPIAKHIILSHGAGRYSVTTPNGTHIASDITHEEARRIARNANARARRAAKRAA